MINYPGVALVTGAASGIGRTVAISFAKEGCCRLALLDMNEAGLKETERLVTQILAATGTPYEIGCFTINVASSENVAATYAAVKTRFSRIDYAVQCAGIAHIGQSSTQSSIELFDRQMTVIYRGLWLCSRETLKIMEGQMLDHEAFPEAGIPPARAQRGAIVNMSSSLASFAQPGSAGYIGAKGAVSALTRADAIDSVGKRIRVNAVLPGIVDSPMTNPNPAVRTLLEETAVQKSPIRRWGLAEEIADVALFLVSNKASLVTGANWAVDGGQTAGHD